MEATPSVLKKLRVPIYTSTTGLTVVITYFNPCRYQTRRNNYDIFVASLRRSGISCITVECAFGEEPFELPETMGVIQVRGDSIVWQKERLLNLAASWLPRNCRCVAWLDCDILFMNPNWAVETVKLLEEYAVVQVFETCVRLVKGNHLINNPNRVPSFGAIVPKDRGTLESGNFEHHGHTGYGWAMRREIFDKIGLYEHAVCGTADHFMAHAIYNDYGFCIRYAFRGDEHQIKHLKEWGERFYALAKGRLAVVPGEILHLWHGDLVNRRYALRMHDITNLGYDPFRDIVVKPGAPLQWHSDMEKPELRQYFIKYFESRREDG